MNIGTAKPSQNELKAVKHHLIDILSPSQSFSAGLFKKKATDTIDSLHRKNKIPIIVGGTGLYMRTLTRGLFDGPEADWTLREKLGREEQRLGKGHLYERLKKIDPESAKKVNQNDARRIIRALEVSLTSGKTITESRKTSTIPGKYHFIKIGLFRDRKELYALIEQRVDTMIKQGLLRETEQLLTMSPARTPLQALGYKEMLLSINESISLEDAVRLLKKRTKMFAKRQIAWFKKEPGIHWVNISGIMSEDKILTRVIHDVAILKDLIYGKRK
jgi:tRNA dimethylallyltransferase